MIAAANSPGRHRRENGTAMLFVVGIFVLLLGFAALAVDVGYMYVLRSQLQNAADAAALAAASNLGDEADSRSLANTYAAYNMQETKHGDVLSDSDIVFGNWDTASRVFTPVGGLAALNAVQITTRRAEVNDNPVQHFFAQAIGYPQSDIAATAVAIGSGQSGVEGRGPIDDEMLDTDVPSIEDLASDLGVSPDDLLSDNDGDWYLDIPPGSQLEVPTGQSGDEGLFNMEHADFPFTSDSNPSFEDFLNYNEDGSWRDDPNVKALLDPLEGVSPINDPSDYDALVNPNVCVVGPVYKSDVSSLGPDSVNALGERRGLLAFKILETRPGTYLPNLFIEICPPVPVDTVQPPLGSSSTQVSLVK